MNLKNGTVTLPYGSIVDNITMKKNFLESKDGTLAILLVKNEDYSSYKVVGLKADDIKLVVMLYFKLDSIYQVQIYFDLDQSEGIDKTENVNKFLEGWLLANLGKPPYNYFWGNVKVITDIKAEFSVIALNYK